MYFVDLSLHRSAEAVMNVTIRNEMVGVASRITGGDGRLTHAPVDRLRARTRLACAVVNVRRPIRTPRLRRVEAWCRARRTASVPKRFCERTYPPTVAAALAPLTGVARHRVKTPTETARLRYRCYSSREADTQPLGRIRNFSDASGALEAIDRQRVYRIPL
jgi:hypothetical protein